MRSTEDTMLLKSYSEVIGSKSGLFGIERKTDTACITIVRNNNWDHGRKGAFWECGESEGSFAIVNPVLFNLLFTNAAS